jgi:hypothetical protein
MKKYGASTIAGTVQRFLEGKEHGVSNHRSVNFWGDTLNSYSSPIVIRDSNGVYVISNYSWAIGGHSYTPSTSNHVYRAWDMIKKSGNKYRVVNGFADVTKPDFKEGSKPPTYKHEWAVMRLFGKGWGEAWCGDYNQETGEQKPLIYTKYVTKNGWHTRDAAIIDGNNNIIAVSEHRGREFDYEIHKYKPCQFRDCDMCGARMLCYTDTEWSGYVYYIISGTKYEKLAKRFINSYAVVDEDKLPARLQRLTKNLAHGIID